MDHNTNELYHFVRSVVCNCSIYCNKPAAGQTYPAGRFKEAQESLYGVILRNQIGIYNTTA